MSLINNMLQDLEHRRGGRPVQDDRILSGLAAVGMSQSVTMTRRMSWRVILGSLSCGLLVASWFYSVGPGSLAALRAFLQPGEWTQAVAKAVTEPAAASQAALPLAVVAVVPQTPLPTAAMTTQVMVLNDMVKQPLAWFDYSSSDEASQAPEIVPSENNDMISTALPPATAAASGIDVSAQLSSHEVKAKAASNSHRLATVADDRDKDTVKGDVIQRGHFSRNSAASVQRSDGLLQQARVQLKAGQSDAAMAGFRQVLQQDRLNTDARLGMATTLARTGQSDAALTILQQGLQLNPQAWRLAFAQARILVSRTEINQAARLLETRAPEVRQAPDYYAYMAGLAQRQGEDEKAIAIYRTILQQDPARGVWWMGLAISLAGNDQQVASVQAFRRSLADPQLPENLRQYIGKQIARLEQVDSK